jgi:hypothetical protein
MTKKVLARQLDKPDRMNRFYWFTRFQEKKIKHFNFKELKKRVPGG